MKNRVSEVNEAQELLTEVVRKEMGGCAIVLLYDTPDALTPLPHALFHIPYGVSLVHIASVDAGTAFTLKVRLLCVAEKHL